MLKRRGDREGRPVLDLAQGLGIGCAGDKKALPVRIESASHLAGVDAVAVRLWQACESDADVNADQDFMVRIISLR